MSGSCRLHLPPDRDRTLKVVERLAGLSLVGLALVLVRVPLMQPGWLAFDDLIPLMYPRQVWDFLTQAWNDYYQWPELRGRYSLLGTPLRYHALIPWGLLLGCLLAGLGAFRLTADLQRRVGLETAAPCPWGPLLAGAAYMMLVLASKAAQLHTLFLGAGLLPWTALTALRALDASTASSQLGWSLLTALLLLLNPAVHLVLLGYVMITVLTWLHRGGLVWAVITLASLGPYSLWLLASGAGPSAAAIAAASGSPTLLAAWSGPFWHRLLLPMGVSLPETYRTGLYVFVDGLFARYPEASYAFTVYTGLALLGLAWGLIWIGGAFMASGVYHALSGYRALILWAEGAERLWEPLALPARVVLTVLRNPDRWTLPAALALFALAGLGLSLVITAVLRWCVRFGPRLSVGGSRASALVGLVVLSAALIPFGVHPAFRPLGSGDLGGVLRPVPLPASYREALELVQGQKVLYLPLMGARPLRWNAHKKTQDEALALLHGGPSLEGMTGGPLLNQLYAGYLYYRGLYEGALVGKGNGGEDGGLAAYLTLAGIRYVLFHDDVEGLPGVTLAEEFTRVRAALEAQRALPLRLQRGDVWVFENPLWRPPEPEVLEGVIVFWGTLDEMVELLRFDPTLPRRFALLHAGEGDVDWPTLKGLAEALGPRLLLYAPRVESLDRLPLSPLAATPVGAVAYPELGWSAEARRWWDHRWLNISAANFPKFAARYGRFGVEGAHGFRLAATVDAGTELGLELVVPEAGLYALFLRLSAPEGAWLDLELNGGLYAQEVVLEPFSSYRFVLVDRLQLKPGRHVLSVRSRTNAPLIVNLAYAVRTDVLRRVQREWEELQQQVAWAKTPTQLFTLVRRAQEGPSASASSTPTLWGLYGPLYWSAREWAGLKPLRSWIVGHLYALERQR